MKKLIFAAAAVAGFAFVAPASAAPSAHSVPSVQTQSDAGVIAETHYRRHAHRHYRPYVAKRHYGWKRGHHYGWRHAHPRGRHHWR